MKALEAALAAIESGKSAPCYLVSGDRVLAEPAALRLGEALAAKAGCRPEVHRRPARFADLLHDLQTYSLFDPAKVIVVVETAILADRAAAAKLIDEAAEGLPVETQEEEPSARQRLAAIRLLQALRLFQIDPQAGASERVIGELPEWSLQGGAAPSCQGRRRSRPKAKIRELRAGLAPLLDMARAAGLEGWGQGELQGLAEVASGSVPEGHVLVLAESSVAADHPVARALAASGALLAVGQVEAGRQGWTGLGLLASELEAQTGAAIARDALEELARRTLRQKPGGRRGDEAVEAESTARLAAEYRKLAEAAAGDSIDLALVELTVADRGEEDVFGILDAIGLGKASEALSRTRRYLEAASDPISARLSFFSLLAGFCRHLEAIGGLLGQRGVPRGESNYNRFKSRVAPALQGDLGGGAKNPLGGIHPYRLHKAYLSACRMAPGRLERLPGRCLEVELQLKGASGSPDAALASLIGEIATAIER